MTETVNCPRCASGTATEWATERGFKAVRCVECGTVYVQNRPQLETISAATREGVHATEAGTLDVRHGYRPRKVAQYAARIREFFPSEKGLRWLDVGAGYGEVVEAVQRAIPEAVAEGIEPMRAKAISAQERGIAITERTLGEVRGRYDVVSLINVFSHVPDFAAFVREIRRVLNPGGSLFIETGNGGDLANRDDYPGELFLPDHLVFAGVSTLSNWLYDLGFQSVDHRSYRIDTTTWALKEMLRSARRARPKLVLPYRRPFRTVFYRAVL